MGQRTINAVTDDGRVTTMAFNACDLNRALGSVSSNCKANNTVVFDAAGLHLLQEHWRIVFGPLLIAVMLINRRGIYGLLFRERAQ